MAGRVAKAMEGGEFRLLSAAGPWRQLVFDIGGACSAGMELVGGTGTFPGVFYSSVVAISLLAIDS